MCSITSDHGGLGVLLCISSFGAASGHLLDHLPLSQVMDLKEEIQMVSNTATQEAALEELLKKVQNTWIGGGQGKPVEFVVTPHKEQKDVYVLGTVDDILVILEDSTVTVSTIITSRFCTGGLRVCDVCEDLQSRARARVCMLCLSRRPCVCVYVFVRARARAGGRARVLWSALVTEKEVSGGPTHWGHGRYVKDWTTTNRRLCVLHT